MDSDQNDDMTVQSPNEAPNPEVFVPQPDSVVEVPSYASEPLQGEPVLRNEVPHYNTNEVVPPPVKKDNRKIWIIIAIVVAVLCCCCIVVTIAALRGMGNIDINNLQDMLNDYSRIIQFVPAFI